MRLTASISRAKTPVFMLGTLSLAHSWGSLMALTSTFCHVSSRMKSASFSFWPKASGKYMPLGMTLMKSKW